MLTTLLPSGFQPNLRFERPAYTQQPTGRRAPNACRAASPASTSHSESIGNAQSDGVEVVAESVVLLTWPQVPKQTQALTFRKKEYQRPVRLKLGLLKQFRFPVAGRRFESKRNRSCEQLQTVHCLAHTCQAFTMPLSHCCFCNLHWLLSNLKHSSIIQ